MFISVIIPTWNKCDLLDKCLQSVYDQSFSELEVIVVDNNSTDGTQNLINIKYKKCIYIKLSKNYGFAKAVNEGIKMSRGDVISFLNNDTVVDRNWIREGIKSIITNRSDVVACCLESYHNSGVIDGVGDKTNIVGQSYSRAYNKKYEYPWNKGCYVFSASGGASFFKRDVLNSVGLFRELYFAYFEDIDLCYRAQKAGFRVWYEPASRVVHHHKATSSQNTNFLNYLLYRNYTISYLINTPFKLFLLQKSLFKFLLVYFHTFYWLSFKENLVKTAIKVNIWLILNLVRLLIIRIFAMRALKSTAYLDSWREKKELKFMWFRF